MSNRHHGGVPSPGWSGPAAGLPTQYWPERDDPPASKPPMTPDTGIRDGNHALLCGEILGCLMAKGIDAEPMMLGNDYTNEIVISRPSGDYRVTVVRLEA